MKNKTLFYIEQGEKSESIAKSISPKYCIGVMDYFTDSYTGERIFDPSILHKSYPWIEKTISRWMQSGTEKIAFYVGEDGTVVDSNTSHADFLDKTIPQIAKKNGYELVPVRKE